jgi:hypothetical protein
LSADAKKEAWTDERTHSCLPLRFIERGDFFEDMNHDDFLVRKIVVSNAFFS